MILVQDQYRQSNRKNYESELQSKQDPGKVYTGSEDAWETNGNWNWSVPKEVWGGKYDEELLTSANETEEDERFFGELDEYQEFGEGRKPVWRKPYKNVRFESFDFNYGLETSETSSLDAEQEDFVGCGYEEHRRPLQDPGKSKDATTTMSRLCHVKPKRRTVDCFEKKYERRPKSTPEKGTGYLDGGAERRPVSLGDYVEPEQHKHRLRRKESSRCGRIHGDAVDHVCGGEAMMTMGRKSSHKFDYGDESFRRHQRHGDCCDHDRRKKTYAKPKPPSHRHLCHGKDGFLEDALSVKQYKKSSYRSVHEKPGDDVHEYHGMSELCYPTDDYHETSVKGKKKVLEVVQEQQEHLSDSTYKMPKSKFSTSTVAIAESGFAGIRSTEKLINSSHSDWLYCGSKHYGEKLAPQYRLHKMRSRRTRMNRLKNGWKKAFVQTVRDAGRNERVGVIVMGPKGPEYYSKNQHGASEDGGSKALESGARSFDVMTVDCKNVYLSSSEPRTNYAIADLACPEDEAKVDEKLAKFSKNVSEIVKTSEEKFYKTLSTSAEYKETNPAEEDGLKEENVREECSKEEGEKEPEEDDGKLKKPTFGPFERFSPRMAKSLRGREKKPTEESKNMADTLNKQAKEFKKSLKTKGDAIVESLKQLQERFPPKEINPELAKANSLLWGIRLDQLSEKNEEDSYEESIGKGNEDGERGNPEESQTAGDRKEEKLLKKEKKEEEKPATVAPPVAEPQPKRISPATKWTNSTLSDYKKKSTDATERNLISEMFSDLVENGCAISQEEAANLQNLFTGVASTAEVGSNDAASDVTSVSKENGRREAGGEDKRVPGRQKTCGEESESYVDDGKKATRPRSNADEKLFRKVFGKGRLKKKISFDDKMKLLRQALPSIAAENEAAHLKQLKKYIDRFIEGVEASASTEPGKRREGPTRRRSRDSATTDDSEVRVDARRILDVVSNPFKKISSDVTINIAKKLTDALVQDRGGSRTCQQRTQSGKQRKNSEMETDDERVPQPSSDSDRCEEPEPTYLKRLKKMRNEHLNNIVLEVKRLADLLRFLDRCNRLSF